MGKTARVKYDIGAIASSLVLVRPTFNVDREFAYYFLMGPAAKQLINIYDNGTAQPNLSAKSIACYPIQLPTIKEQCQLVKQVETLFAHADAI